METTRIARIPRAQLARAEYQRTQHLRKIIISPKYLPTLETLLVLLGVRSTTIRDLVHVTAMRPPRPVHHRSPGAGATTIADTASVLAFKLPAQTDQAVTAVGMLAISMMCMEALNETATTVLPTRLELETQVVRMGEAPTRRSKIL